MFAAQKPLKIEIDKFMRREKTLGIITRQKYVEECTFAVEHPLGNPLNFNSHSRVSL
jgi:hypothetical protein